MNPCVVPPPGLGFPLESYSSFYQSTSKKPHLAIPMAKHFRQEIIPSSVCFNCLLKMSALDESTLGL